MATEAQVRELAEQIRRYLRRHFYPMAANQALPVTAELRLRGHAEALALLAVAWKAASEQADEGGER